jgi:flagellar biosynthesis protein FliQ
VNAIGLVDLPSLERARRRTTRVRAVLAAMLIALPLVAFVAGRHTQQQTLRFLPHGASGVVVLDLSASVSSDTYQRIGQTLRDLAATNGRYGLVVFSDVAYQALPPGSPAAALRPFARYFTLPPAQEGFLGAFPTNPWTNTFSGGTRIASGLGLALQVLRSERVAHPAVVLVSDLDDDPGDLKALAGVALAYRHEHIPVRVVALDPQPRDRSLFTHLLEGAATVQQGRLPGERIEKAGARVPQWLATVAVLAALLAAANEINGATLTWRRA